MLCYFIFCVQAVEFFFFAILIGVITLLFSIMSYFFKYVDVSKAQDSGRLSPDEKDESTALIPEKNENETASDEEPKLTTIEDPSEREF